MPIQHSVITDPHLHEPKGISTAVSGMAYFSNGVGGGSWQYLTPVSTFSCPNTSTFTFPTQGTSGLTDQQVIDGFGYLITTLTPSFSTTLEYGIPVTLASSRFTVGVKATYSITSTVYIDMVSGYSINGGSRILFLGGFNFVNLNPGDTIDIYAGLKFGATNPQTNIPNSSTVTLVRRL